MKKTKPYMDIELDGLNRGQLTSLRGTLGVKLIAACREMSEFDADAAEMREGKKKGIMMRTRIRSRNAFYKRMGDAVAKVRHVERQISRTDEMIRRRNAEGKGIGF